MSEEQSPKVVAYLKEILAVGEKYGFSLSHEDGQGAFQVEPLSQLNAEWLLAAQDLTQSEIDLASR